MPCSRYGVPDSRGGRLLPAVVVSSFPPLPWGDRKSLDREYRGYFQCFIHDQGFLGGGKESVIQADVGLYDAVNSEQNEELQLFQAPHINLIRRIYE